MMPKTGDVLLTRGHSALNAITCWATGPAAHQETFFDSRTTVGAIKGKGIVQTRFDEFVKAAQIEQREWIVFHWPEQFSNGQVWRMKYDMLEAMEFQRYSTLELPLQFIDALWAKLLRKPRQGLDAIVFRRLGRIWDNGVICSKTSNRVLIKAGLIPVESGLEYGSPSDTYRWLMRCERCVVLQCSPRWFDYPGAKKDELGRAALPGLLGRYPWRS